MSKGARRTMGHYSSKLRPILRIVPVKFSRQEDVHSRIFLSRAKAKPRVTLPRTGRIVEAYSMPTCHLTPRQAAKFPAMKAPARNLL